MRKGWNETLLGKLITLQTGKLDVNAGVEDGEFPFFTCSRETYRIDVAAHAGKSVIVAGNGDLNVKYYEGEFNAYQRTYILQAIDEVVLNPLFLFHFMEKYVETLRNDTQGSTIQYLKKAQFTEAPVSLPPLVEQERIVDLVSSVDVYIDALQKQANAARSSRNAVLHELLSAGGDDWTETTLGDIVDVIDPHPSHRAPPEHDGGVPFIGIGDVRDGGRTDFDRARKVSPEVLKEHAVRYDRKQKLIGLGRVASIGLVVRLPTDGVDYAVSPTLAVLRPRNIDTNFLFYYLQADYLQEQLQTFKRGSTRQSVGMLTLRELKVILPPLVEQKRIVDVVSSMDEVVQSTEHAVIDAKNLRSGLLSDLLSGEHEFPESYDSLLGAA